MPPRVVSKGLGKGFRVMVWGEIVGNRKSVFMLMEHNENPPCQGYSTLSYLQSIGNQPLELYDEDKWFMHDNAPIHKAQVITTWLEYQNIDVYDFPLYLPDLSPIETCGQFLRHALLPIILTYNQWDKHSMILMYLKMPYPMNGTPFQRM